MRIAANGIGIEVRDQGAPGAEPLLLIMGLGMQLIGWPDELVQALLGHGFRVVRFDNRDAGLSDGFDAAGAPGMAGMTLAALRHAFALPVRAPYALADMAADAVGVLDALGIARAHVCGASLGGMVAQHIAARHPDRVRSLTLLMTTSGARSLPRAPSRVQQALMSRPAGKDRDAIVRHLERVLQVIGSPAFPPEPKALRERLQASVERAWRPAGTTRQLLAVAADGDRSALLPRITAPVQVIHGTADVLIPPASAHDLVKKLPPGALLDAIDGMGHDLPQQLLQRFADAIAANARRAAPTASPAARRV